MKKTNIAAVDLGATSGRVIVGTFSGEGLELNEVHRFPNGFHTYGGHSYWDLGALISEVRAGLAKACELYPDLRSVGVDTWGVDHVLMDANHRLVFPVHAYRDTRTEPIMNRIAGSEDAAKLYEWTGLPPVSYNTGLQLMESLQAVPGLRETCDRVLLLSDYFNFVLSGVARNEFSQASTSQLLDASGLGYSAEALDYFGVPSHWFQGPDTAGRVLGKLKNVRGGDGVDVVMVPGHDTSCAFEAIPRDGETMLVSSGTWILAGGMTRGPLLSPEASKIGISNERTGSGGYRPLKILIGLWLLEQTIPSFDKRPSSDAEWNALIEAAEDRPQPEVLIDTSDRALFNPSNMREAIDAQLKKNGGTPPTDLAGYMRLISSSLGESVARFAEQFSELTGTQFDNIVIVGGGAKNRLLCQMMANASGIAVTSYALEATSIGNMAYQLIALGVVDSIDAFHDIIRPTLSQHRYEPQK